MLITAGGLAVNQFLFPSINYDPVKNKPRQLNTSLLDCTATTAAFEPRKQGKARYRSHGCTQGDGMGMGISQHQQ